MKMTRLMEFLSTIGIASLAWTLVVFFPTASFVGWSPYFLPLPFIVLVTFGIYSVVTVLWRVYTFNDCDEAANQLQEEIQQAKKDLKEKGFKFEVEE